MWVRVGNKGHNARQNMNENDQVAKNRHHDASGTDSKKKAKILTNQVMEPAKFFRQVELPQQKLQDDGLLFPAVLSPPNSSQQADDLCSFEEAIRAHKPWLECLLQKRGAILFRGFSVNSASDFNSVVEAFGFPEALYIGGRAPRAKVIGRVYTANESPAHIGIPFHHEMAYVRDYPSKLFFFCEEEPGNGGETPIVLSHIIYEKMKERHPESVARLEEHGLLYTNMIGVDADSSSFTGSSWKLAYMTEDKKIAEQRAAKLGTKLEWIGNSAKMTTGPLLAIRFDEASQKKTWFNNMAVAYKGQSDWKNDDENNSVKLGNGEIFPNDAMEDCLRILEEECVAIPWKKGDILLINNLMVLHARRPLLKPPRRVLASLCK